MRRRVHGPRLDGVPGGSPSGASVLIAAAAILALTAFAAMCTASSAADARILVRETSAETEWREADRIANEILGCIRAGKDPAIWQAAVREQDGVYSYAVPAGNGRMLSAEVRADPETGEYAVLSWKAVRSEEWSPDLSVEVWDGT